MRYNIEIAQEVIKTDIKNQHKKDKNEPHMHLNLYRTRILQ